jgi:hypothetical protein
MASERAQKRICFGHAVHGPPVCLNYETTLCFCISYSHIYYSNAQRNTYTEGCIASNPARYMNS